MNVTGVSSISGASFAPPTTDNLRQTFKSLVSAIQSGDVAAASQAYTTLTQSGSTLPSGPIGQDLSAIGAALKNNDLTGAQQALSTLETDVHKLRGGHHHHHHGGESTSTVGTATSPTSSDPNAPAIPAPGSTISVQA